MRRRFIYLDPDYADKDAGRYPWLAQLVSARGGTGTILGQGMVRTP